MKAAVSGRLSDHIAPDGHGETGVRIRDDPKKPGKREMRERVTQILRKAGAKTKSHSENP